MVLKVSIVFAMYSVLTCVVALPGLRYAMPESPAFTIAEETPALVVPSSRSMIGVMLAAQVTPTAASTPTPTPTERVLAVTQKSSTKTSKTAKTTPASSCVPLTVCIDYLNTCGVRYGGCHDMCKPTSYTDPGCPKTKRPCNLRAGNCP
ncbi:hypothetical protein IWX90DRAFT_18359 [Phyllosticta citrichinensis]|uniref:Uncharacterized protein n=1 Tax=Phyllosticta citrichinensis TaxID=1130410 RepID=A0ABR1Y6H9_9PEZI